MYLASNSTNSDEINYGSNVNQTQNSLSSKMPPFQYDDNVSKYHYPDLMPSMPEMIKTMKKNIPDQKKINDNNSNDEPKLSNINEGSIPKQIKTIQEKAMKKSEDNDDLRFETKAKINITSNTEKSNYSPSKFNNESNFNHNNQVINKNESKTENVNMPDKDIKIINETQFKNLSQKKKIDSVLKQMNHFPGEFDKIGRSVSDSIKEYYSKSVSSNPNNKQKRQFKLNIQDIDPNYHQYLIYLFSLAGYMPKDDEEFVFQANDVPDQQSEQKLLDIANRIDNYNHYFTKKSRKFDITGLYSTIFKIPTIHKYLRIKKNSNIDHDLKIDDISNQFEIMHTKAKHNSYLNEYIVKLNNGEQPVSANVEQVFDIDDKQKVIFETFKDSIEKLFDGKDCTIIAYGPTNSGKKYTMFGSNNAHLKNDDLIEIIDETDGLLPRIIHYLYEYNERNTNNINSIMKIKFLFFQIFNEKYIDLLERINDIDQINKINMREASSIHIQDYFKTNKDELILQKAKSRQQILQAFKAGLKQKILWETKGDLYVSRCTTIFRIYLEYTSNDEPMNKKSSILTLVGLTGSEAYTEDNQKYQLHQHYDGNLIMKSLNELKKYLLALNINKKANIFLGESLLTKVLERQLIGDGNLIIIGHLVYSIAFQKENMNTLMFMDMHTKDQPKKNMKASKGNNNLLEIVKEIIDSHTQQVSYTQISQIEFVNKKLYEATRLDQLLPMQDQINKIEEKILALDISTIRVDHAAGVINFLKNLLSDLSAKMNLLEEKKKLLNYEDNNQNYEPSSIFISEIPEISKPNLGKLKKLDKQYQVETYNINQHKIKIDLYNQGRCLVCTLRPPCKHYTDIEHLKLSIRDPNQIEETRSHKSQEKPISHTIPNLDLDQKGYPFYKNDINTQFETIDNEIKSNSVDPKYYKKYGYASSLFKGDKSINTIKKPQPKTISYKSQNKSPISIKEEYMKNLNKLTELKMMRQRYLLQLRVQETKEKKMLQELLHGNRHQNLRSKRGDIDQNKTIDTALLRSNKGDESSLLIQLTNQEKID